MADVDQQDKTSPTNQTVGVTSAELDAKLSAVTEMLKAVNAQNQEAYQNLASAIKPAQKAQPVFTDDAMYDPGKLQEAVTVQASKIARDMLKSERELNTTVYNMAQEYPEIQTDPQIQKAVREAQATLPENMRDTALGLETAILKAASKAGLMPKSKRSAPVDDDIYVAPRGSGEQRKSSRSQKVDQRTLEFAELLGRDIEDPQVLKGLEEATKRDSYSKYR
jgi:hypothetical protein